MLQTIRFSSRRTIGVAAGVPSEADATASDAAAEVVELCSESGAAEAAVVVSGAGREDFREADFFVFVIMIGQFLPCVSRVDAMQSLFASDTIIDNSSRGDPERIGCLGKSHKPAAQAQGRKNTAAPARMIFPSRSRRGRHGRPARDYLSRGNRQDR